MNNPKRWQRSDTGRTTWTDHDSTALTWMAQQYAMRMDHVHGLLWHLSKRSVCLGTTRSVVSRQIRETCTQMLSQGVLTEGETRRICIKGYQPEDDEARGEALIPWS